MHDLEIAPLSEMHCVMGAQASQTHLHHVLVLSSMELMAIEQKFQKQQENIKVTQSTLRSTVLGNPEPPSSLKRWKKIFSKPAKERLVEQT